MTRTYWLHNPRGFANEYDVGIATTAAHAKQYRAQGYERISRAEALQKLSTGGDAATQIYNTVTINGEQGPCDCVDVARSIRAGTGVAFMRWSP